MSQPPPTPGSGEREGVVRRPHECNLYCEPDLHAGKYYTHEPLTADTVAILMQDGSRHEIVKWIVATELPPVDPTDPAGEAFTHRYIVWSRQP